MNGCNDVCFFFFFLFLVSVSLRKGVQYLAVVFFVQKNVAVGDILANVKLVCKLSVELAYVLFLSSLLLFQFLL